MKLTADESRALAFIALLIVLSVGARLLDRPEEVALDALGVDVAALEAASRDGIRRGREPPPAPLAAGERIDPNTAPPEQLRRLPRATAALAARIVEDRERNGPFRSIQDLDRVQGIGPATLEAWTQLLTLPRAHGAQAMTTTPARRTTSSPSAPAQLLELSSATAAELERLPGVGPALAARIIAYRDSAGGFRSIDQLMQVRGIGPVLLEKVKPLVRLNGIHR
jgi:competence protein ComEA